MNKHPLSRSPFAWLKAVGIALGLTFALVAFLGLAWGLGLRLAGEVEQSGLLAEERDRTAHWRHIAQKRNLRLAGEHAERIRELAGEKPGRRK